jgi:RNA methyltransferase, TrmH family
MHAGRPNARFARRLITIHGSGLAPVPFRATMEQIDSPQNRYVKQFRALATPRGRADHGLMQLEGVRMLEEALGAEARLRWVAFCPERVRGGRANTLLREASRRGIEVLPLTQRAFDAMTETVSPAGIAAACEIPRTRLADIALAEAARLLAVYEVRDPGNMGTMIRTADAFGCAGVVAVGDCVDLYSPKVVRATAGSLFHLPLAQAKWGEFRAWATEHQVALIATASEGGVCLPEAHFPERSALIIGSEAHGLPEPVLTAADMRVTIPMPGAAESLNAAVAAGIVLYQIAGSGS